MADDQLNQDVLLKIHRYEITYKLLANLIRWVGLVFLGYWTYRTIETLAGQTTVAEFGIDVGVLSNVGFGRAVMVILTAIALAYGLSERSLRRKTVERLQDRIKMLENEKDPNRTSSTLTARGETRPEDKL